MIFFKPKKKEGMDGACDLYISDSLSLIRLTSSELSCYSGLQSIPIKNKFVPELTVLVEC